MNQLNYIFWNRLIHVPTWILNLQIKSHNRYIHKYSLGSYSVRPDVVLCMAPLKKGGILIIISFMFNLRLDIGSNVCWELLYWNILLYSVMRWHFSKIDEFGIQKGQTEQNQKQLFTKLTINDQVTVFLKFFLSFYLVPRCTVFCQRYVYCCVIPI